VTIWTVAALVGVLAVGPFLLPVPEQDGFDERELANSADRFVTIDGIDVRIRQAGHGPVTFVLLHGFGANAASWEPVAASLGAPSVAFDRVGFGLTDRPTEWSGENPYSGEVQVDITRHLVDRFGSSDVVLVGHSAGAAVAVAAALELSPMGLVLEAPSLEGAPGPLRWLAATPQGNRLVRFLAGRADIGELLASAYHDPSRITSEMLAAYKLPMSVEGWDVGLARFVAAEALSDMERRVTELDLPVLVITGDDDRWVDTADTIRLAERIPGARLVVVPECGHVVHEECPDAFVAAVTEWLNDVGG
jgi:pimeloyl-ACP methyl ester carboxylesterase